MFIFPSDRANLLAGRNSSAVFDRRDAFEDGFHDGVGGRDGAATG
ncbi:hypothetical protein [Mycobacterium riyadhense]|nr:hypothetical protein [Mycobacterium riyadhense]